ncbi:TetR/AcrR family transcriptional regulator [Enterococcus sp. DIV0876]|uniref:TetR/AcrR family transcriptional regulator n=1 Tax=Enterococcus sp. DIV0876 TaxID=2774633 RepID=UPI003D30056F
MNLLEEIKKHTQEDNNKTEKQKQVELSAIRLFAERGFSNTSTKEIAMEAQVSEGLIFKYYGKKENLLINLILPMIKEVIPQLSTEVEEIVKNHLPKTFKDFLRVFLINRLDFLSENRMLFRVMVKEVFYSDELRSQLAPYFMENVPPLLNEVIDHYKKKGELSSISKDQITNNLITLLGGFFVSRFLLFENYEPKEQEVEQLIQFIMYGIDRGDGLKCQ